MTLLFRDFRYGIADCIKVIIIDDDMYGITPSAKIPILPNAPPENVSKIPNIPEVVQNCCNAKGLIPGIGKKVLNEKLLTLLK